MKDFIGGGGVCLSAAKEFLSRKVVCVCEEAAFWCGRKTGSAKEMLLDCVWARTSEAVKEPGQSLDKREKCDLWIHLFPLSASLWKCPSLLPLAY